MKNVRSCILLLCCLLTGCTVKPNIEIGKGPSSRDFGELQIPNATDTIDTAKWDTFVNEKDNYEEATMKLTQYTTEGDPIMTTLLKSTKYYSVMIDSSNDKFRGNDDPITTKTYTYLYDILGSELEVIPSFYAKEDPSTCIFGMLAAILANIP